MQSAKIHLSPEQIKLVTDATFILTKNEILQSIKITFEQLYITQQSIVGASFPTEVLKPGGKISRGENYLGLPWIVLDNPRCFIKENIFAVRTMFWWGRYFSTTLHLSGKWEKMLAPKLVHAFHQLKNNNFYISYAGNEWIHNINSNSYSPIKNLSQQSFEEIIATAPFIKIAAYTGMENIETAAEILIQQFKVLVNSIS